MSLQKVTVTCIAVLVLTGCFPHRHGMHEEPAAASSQQAELAQTTKGTMMPMGAKAMMDQGTSMMPMDPKAMMNQCMSMMQQAGMSQDMIQRWQVMMQTPIFLDSPCAIYGQADTLGLSEEQKTRLGEIEADARKKALAVLTPEQREKMGAIPPTPMPMIDMCQEMMPKMMHMMKDMPAGQGADNPMMQMMQKMMGGQTSQDSGGESGK